MVGVGRFKDPLQADRALERRACATWSAWSGARSPTPTSRPRPAPGHATDIRTCLSCNQECVGRMGLNRGSGCIENPRTGRESVAASRRPPPAPTGGGGRRRARRAAGRGDRRRAGPPGRPVRAPRPARRPGPGGGQRAQPGRVPRHHPQPDRGRPPAGRRRAYRHRGRPPTLVRAERPDVVVAGHRRPPGPPVVGRRPCRGWSTSATCWRAGPTPTGTVVVVDELGFHQATSVAELLADRGCQVEIVTNGMVVGQDLGITLDMETWNVRAHAKGIGQSTDLVPMGVADGRRRRRPSSCTCSTTRPAPTSERRVRLGGLRRAPAARGRAVARARATRRSRSTGSATAWPPGGPTPRSSRATGWRWRCEPSLGRRPDRRAGRGGGPGRAGCRPAPTRRWPRPAGRRVVVGSGAEDGGRGRWPAPTRVWWAETGDGLRRPARSPAGWPRSSSRSRW